MTEKLPKAANKKKRQADPEGELIKNDTPVEAASQEKPAEPTNGDVVTEENPVKEGDPADSELHGMEMDSLTDPELQVQVKKKNCPNGQDMEQGQDAENEGQVKMEDNSTESIFETLQQSKETDTGKQAVTVELLTDSEFEAMEKGTQAEGGSGGESINELKQIKASEEFLKEGEPVDATGQVLEQGKEVEPVGQIKIEDNLTKPELITTEQGTQTKSGGLVVEEKESTENVIDALEQLKLAEPKEQAMENDKLKRNALCTTEREKQEEPGGQYEPGCEEKPSGQEDPGGQGLEEDKPADPDLVVLDEWNLATSSGEITKDKNTSESVATATNGVQPAEPVGEVQYDNILVIPVHQTFQPLTWIGISNLKSFRIGEILCESFTPASFGGGPSQRVETCPR